MPLRVHFLNVGHGDCTIIEHPSGRLTMIDINNSQKFDADSTREFVEERRGREAPEQLLAGLGAPTNALFGAIAAPRSGLEPLGGGFNTLGSGLNALGGGFNALRGGFNALAVLEQMRQDEEAATRELTDPIDYMRDRFRGRSLFRYVQTHPDLDHMRGLMRLHHEIGFANFWDIAHDKQIDEFRSDDDRDDWQFYQRVRRGFVSGVKVLTLQQQAAGFAWNEEPADTPGGDWIEILSPTQGLLAACRGTDEFNDASYVLRVWHFGKSLLLPGDAGELAWKSLMQTYGSWLKSDLMKGSHHGRDSGYNLEAVKLIAPRSVIVSVGRKPPTDASRKYHQQCGDVASTRYYGNIVLQIQDDGSWRWFVQRNFDSP